MGSIGCVKYATDQHVCVTHYSLPFMESAHLNVKRWNMTPPCAFAKVASVINPLAARSRHCGRRIPCFLAVASPNCRISLPRRYRAGKLTLPDQISLSGCLALPSQCALFALRYVPLKVRGSSEIHVRCSHTIVDLVLLSPRRSAQSFRSGDCIGTPWREYQIPRTHIIALLELDDSLLLSGRKPSVVFSNTRQ